MGIFCSSILIYKQLKPGSFISRNYSAVHVSLIQKRWLQSLCLHGSRTARNIIQIWHTVYFYVCWFMLCCCSIYSLWTSVCLSLTLYSHTMTVLKRLTEGCQRDVEPPPVLFFMWPFLPGRRASFKRNSEARADGAMSLMRYSGAVVSAFN